MRKEYKIVLKYCLNFGLLIGASLMIASFLFYKNGYAINMNPNLSNINYMLAISGIFIGVRKLRNDMMNGFISYGQALFAGIVMMSFAAIAFALYSYTLFSSDPALSDNFISLMKENLQNANWEEERINTYMKIYETLISPAMVALVEFFNKVFIGILFSIFLAGILMRKRNIFVTKENNIDENKN